ncbi:hypothetical protein [Maridesulfovibrio sp.]|uniref:hypothetical protein n=1 Tax=Maridesulfovibrio sp. TaxID=2795000 RepID=UPI002A188963|nr:hypothetical protein [Maridesulfovibrio sp.]
MSKRNRKSDNRMVQLTLPLSSLPSQSLESGSLRRFEAVKEALGHALKECGLSRDVVAEELSRLTGHQVSIHQLNNWAAPGKEDRPIPLHFVAALTEITEDYSLIKAALEGTGCKLLGPEEVAYFELGIMAAEDKKRTKKRKELWDKIGK